MNIDLNNNSVECIKSINNIGSTTYHNICTGVDSVVGWGAMDWIGAITIVCVILGLFYVVIYVVIMLREIE